jgi:16S rRNA (cytidine1402-2'-O)-methyltransferase
MAEKNKIPGKLFIVATPIGNPQDITLRALETLRTCDAVICEEFRQGHKLLSKLGISGKEILTLNEHNERQQSSEIVLKLFQGQSLALVSDCGTPVFADPGHYLVREVTTAGISVVPVPGPSSIMAALSILDFKLDSFIFAGFLPRENSQRLVELRRLEVSRLPVILMDTPYRMEKLLEEVSQVFGKQQQITLACDLTLPAEAIYRGSIESVRKQVSARKAEFILIVHPRKTRSAHPVMP